MFGPRDITLLSARATNVRLVSRAKTALHRSATMSMPHADAQDNVIRSLQISTDVSSSAAGRGRRSASDVAMTMLPKFTVSAHAAAWA